MRSTTNHGDIARLWNCGCRQLLLNVPQGTCLIRFNKWHHPLCYSVTICSHAAHYSCYKKVLTGSAFIIKCFFPPVKNSELWLCWTLCLWFIAHCKFLNMNVFFCHQIVLQSLVVLSPPLTITTLIYCNYSFQKYYLIWKMMKLFLSTNV